MFRRLALPALCIAAVLLFGACAPERVQEEQPAQLEKYENTNEAPVDGGTLRLCLFETDSLNPLITQNTENIKTLKLMYDGLFTVHPDFSYTPELCESYAVTEDGMHYTFQIKNGIYFHDGARLTVDDVIFSLRLLFEAESPYAEQLSDIKTYSAKDQALQIELRRPVANFPALLDFPVISEHTAANAKDALKEKAEYVPNGTGPYKLQSYKKNKELFLTANEGYHEARYPHISGIQIYMLSDRDAAVSLFETLGIDLLSSNVIDPGQYTPKRGVSSVEYATNRFTYIAFNMSCPALSTVATRSAVSAAVDRDALVRTVAGGRAVPCDIPIHPSSWLYRSDQAVTAFDPEQARVLLLQDGWTDSDGDGVLDRMTDDEAHDAQALSLRLLVNENNQQRLRIANQIKLWLEDVGMKISVESLPFSEYADRLNRGQFDLAVCEVDISTNSDLKFLLQTDNNVCSIASDAIDDLLLQADKTADTAQIMTIYSTLCTFLQQEAVMAGLYFKNDSLICDRSLRGNIQPNVSSFYGNIHEWFIK